MELDDSLLEIFREVMGKDDLELSSASTFEDVPEWDSISHVNLLAAIEERFQVKFTTAQIMQMNSFGAIRDALASKLPANPA